MQKMQEQFSACARTFGATRSITRRVVLKLLDLGLDSGNVGIAGFLGYVALQRCQRFAPGSEADTLVIGQFVG